MRKVNFMKKLVRLMPVVLAAVSGQGARAEDDSYRLMMAAMVNVFAGFAPLCEVREPGYQRKFDEALRLAEEKFLSKEGVDSAMRTRAEEIPEFASAQTLRKFDGWEESKRKAGCAQGLEQLKQMAEAEAPGK